MKPLWVFGFLALFLAACSSRPEVDWNSRVGVYTYDNAVVELGPPDKSADLSDGSRVSEWVVRRGYSRGGMAFGFGGGFGGHHHYGYGGPMFYHPDPPSPDVFLRLVFGQDGTLKEWKRYMR